MEFIIVSKRGPSCGSRRSQPAQAKLRWQKKSASPGQVVEPALAKLWQQKKLASPGQVVAAEEVRQPRPGCVTEGVRQPRPSVSDRSSQTAQANLWQQK